MMAFDWLNHIYFIDQKVAISISFYCSKLLHSVHFLTSYFQLRYQSKCDQRWRPAPVKKVNYRVILQDSRSRRQYLSLCYCIGNRRRDQEQKPYRIEETLAPDEAKCCSKCLIRKTCPCNVYNLEPQFLYTKTGLCRGISIFRIFAPNIDCGYSLEPPRRNSHQLKIFNFYNLGKICTSHVHVLAILRGKMSQLLINIVCHVKNTIVTPARRIFTHFR